MRSKILVAALLVVLGAFASGLTACTGPSCTRNTDCETPLVCNAVGLCDVKPVVVDSDGGDGDGGDADGGTSGSTGTTGATDDGGAATSDTPDAATDGLAP